MNYYFDVFKRWRDYEGFTTRKEYWMFTLISCIIFLVISVVDNFLYGDQHFLKSLYILFIWTPVIALHCRRLHDVGKSGWWQAIGLIPVVGPIWVLIQLARPGFVVGEYED